jgi:hypothetical protein
MSAVPGGQLLLAQPHEAQTGVLRQVFAAEAKDCWNQVN